MAKIKINSGNSIGINKPGNRVGINKTAAAPSALMLTVADHLYGAQASVTQCTDTLASVRAAGELCGFKFNVALTAFVSRYDGRLDDVTNIHGTGRIKAGCYIPTDRWKNPNTGNIEIIPDYVATAWTAAGAAVFPVTIGAAKVTRYPNHGQELYELTSGTLGWDHNTGTPGANGGAEWYAVMDEIDSYFQTFLGIKPSTGSYRNGQTGSKFLNMRRFLAGRNSDLNYTSFEGQAYTSYGRSKATSQLLGRPQLDNNRGARISSFCSSRTQDTTSGALDMGTQTQAKNFLAAQVAQAILDGGYYMDFNHWHNATAAFMHDNIISTIGNAVAGANVANLSYSEMMEYLFLRDMVTSVQATGASNITVSVTLADPYKGQTIGGIDTAILYDRIRVPISIKINTTGTALEGKELQTTNGTVCKLSANEFVLNIPFGGAEGTVSTTISETVSPNYLSLAKPAISSYTKDSSTLTVNTSLPTKAVLFTVAAGGIDYNSAIHARSNSLGAQHTFNISAVSATDLRVGLVTAAGQSILSNILT